MILQSCNNHQLFHIYVIRITHLKKFHVTIPHTFATMQSVGIELDNVPLGSGKTDGLPSGVINDVREFARSKLCLMNPIG